VNKRIFLALLIVSGILILDQITKSLIVQTVELHQRIPVLPSFFDLTHLRNTGAAFSILAQSPPAFRQPFFFIATGVAIIALVFFLLRVKGESVLLVVATASILGGAIGNLIDRIRYGEVVDFLLFYWGDYYWPAFNVADTCITLGVIGLLWASVRNHNPETPRARTVW